MAVKFAPLTADQLIRILRTYPKDAFVVMSSDAEGNSYHALAADGLDHMDGENVVVLYPSHDTFSGWVTKVMREMFG